MNNIQREWIQIVNVKMHLFQARNIIIKSFVLPFKCSDYHLVYKELIEYIENRILSGCNNSTVALAWMTGTVF